MEYFLIKNMWQGLRRPDLTSAIFLSIRLMNRFMISSAIIKVASIRLYRSDIIRYNLFGIDHYKLPGMQNLADRVSPFNVMSVAAIYKFFWDTTH